MTANVTPIRAVATIGGNSGNNGNSDDNPFASPGAEADNLLVDLARDVASTVIDTAQLEEGVTAKATETAVRVLLLAAADLWRSEVLFGRGLFVSTVLLAALDEAMDALTTPAPKADEDAVRDRLSAAARAGLRGDDAPPRRDAD